MQTKCKVKNNSFFAQAFFSKRKVVGHAFLSKKKFLVKSV